MTTQISQRIAIIDFGSQTTQLIARRVRELKVYSEVFPCTVTPERLAEFAPNALILSGGPASVSEHNAPTIADAILELPIPILGICYGMQLLMKHFGGHVASHHKKEFGRTLVHALQPSALFSDIADTMHVWMSHGDQVLVMPDDFMTLAKSGTCPHAVVAHKEKPILGVQFHPEVTHTENGTRFLHNFLFEVAGLTPSWKMQVFLDEKVQDIQHQVKDGKVLMGLSGGVDSSVAAALIHKAIGDRLICVYVDHGLSRAGELEEIQHLFGSVHKMDVRIVHATDEFAEALAEITDPEKKRKIIGRLFIEVFEREAKKLENIQFLGQGTLYPDVIESQSFHGGPSAVIKSHHNVGGLPERMNLKLVEPLRELFKDEVRELGRVMGLPNQLVNRQPFPGPGLAVRIMGEVTKQRLDLLRQADAIVRHEIEEALAHQKITVPLWQWFAVYLPVRSVGVMGDARTYGDTIAVRCVESTDGMTADFTDIPHGVLGRISNRIINEVLGISRVVYDISSKPPSTIEWE